MLKWLLTLAIAVVIIGLFSARLRRSGGLRQLPGDVRWHHNGREYTFPFASTLLLSLLVALIGWLL